MKIEIWSDIACPWCFIGKRRFEGALASFAHRDSVEVRWRSYQLDPDLPERYDGTEFEYLATRKGLAPEQVSQMFQHVKQTAADEGLNYDFDSLVVANSLRAHQLLHAASASGLADIVKERLLSDHFEHGLDIGDVNHLVSIAADVGLDGDDVRAALTDGRYLTGVRADIDDAQRLGLSGVPFFVIDRTYGISGAQPTSTFARVLEQAWQASHPLEMVVVESADACGPDGCSL